MRAETPDLYDRLAAFCADRIARIMCGSYLPSSTRKPAPAPAMRSRQVIRAEARAVAKAQGRASA
jgi:hypothetical protein